LIIINRMRQKKLHIILSGHYFLTHISFFGVLSTLILILSKKGLPPQNIAFISLVYTISYRGSKLLFAPFLDRLETEKGIYLGCLIASLGFFILFCFDHPKFILLAILLAGLGISINGISSKVFAMNIAEKDAHKNSIFSIIATIVNFSAAISQPISLALLKYDHEKILLISFSLFYFIPFLIFFIKSLSNKSKNISKNNIKKQNLNVYLKFLKNKNFIYFFLINFLIWSLYGQLYNAFAYHIGKTLNNPLLLGQYYFALSVFVIAFQIFVIKIANRYKKNNPYKNIFYSMILYSIGYFIIFLNCEKYSAAFFIILFIGLAEILFVPSLDVLGLTIAGKENKNVWISIVGISTALGESLGGSLGLLTYGLLKNIHLYWLLISIFSIILSILTLFVFYYCNDKSKLTESQ